MIDLPPVALPTEAKANEPAPGYLKTAWDYKHAAATVALVFGVVAPYIVQLWPASAPVVDHIEQVAKKIEAAPEAKPTEKPIEKPTPYEIAIREAWEIESGFGIQLKRLIVLYRASAKNVATARTMTELRASFDANEKRLGTAGTLPFVRDVIQREWERRFPVVADELTDATRAAVADFRRQTIVILERLP